MKFQSVQRVETCFSISIMAFFTISTVALKKVMYLVDRALMNSVSQYLLLFAAMYHHLYTIFSE